MRSDKLALSTAVSQLCPTCGLCCNGVLFADVRLRGSDRPDRLGELGLDLHRQGRIISFPQPCACLISGLCQIYSDRPQRCRTFECGVLKRLVRGEETISRARIRIARALRQARQVERLLEQTGHPSGTKPLSRRYAEAMAEPIDLAGDPKRIRLRARLMVAMDRLMSTLEKEFLS